MTVRKQIGAASSGAASCCSPLQRRITHATIREYAKLAPARKPCPACLGSGVALDHGHSRVCDCRAVSEADAMRLYGNVPVLALDYVSADDA